MLISEKLKSTVELAISSGKETRYSIAKNAGVDYATFSRWLDTGRDIRSTTIDKLGVYFRLELKRAK